MSYAGRTKYDEPGRAERYARRSPRRDAEEWALLAELIARLPARPAEALDVPCGTGRIAERLIAAGIPCRCADLSPAMRMATEERLEAVDGFRGVAALDLEALPEPAPQSAPLVVCMRLLHHLPDGEHRRRVLTSLRALASADLLVSFHHPVSFHNLGRAFRRLWSRRPGDRYTIRPRKLASEARAAGFEVVAMKGLAPWRREFWVAWLRVPGD